MNVLITGIAGFVGHYLCDELTKAGHRVVGIDLKLANCPAKVADAVALNLTDAAAIGRAIEKLRPEACVHLGGIASPPIGRKNPQLMLNTNILGTSFLLEALRETAPQCRFLLASTAFVYGKSDAGKPLAESDPLRPNGIYAVSKAAADIMTLAYARDYGMHTMCARPANHTGPGQSDAFVVAAFASQVNAIANHKRPPVMRVGNLESERAFLDVRDVVRAYRLLIEKGHPGTAYNIASSEMVTIRFILDELCRIAGISPRIETDPELYRPTDKSPILDAGRITADTGWQPGIPLPQTLRDMLSTMSAPSQP